MTTDRSRVLLIGFGPTAISALESLVHHFDVVGLVRDVDDEVVQLARRLRVPVFSKTSAVGVAEAVALVDPDCVVVSSYDRILPEEMVQERPFINVHYSPLPMYRGRANVNWAIINHETKAAVTLHCIVPGLDAGGILEQEFLDIRAGDTIGTLYVRLNMLQGHLLPHAVRRRLSGDLGHAQAEAEATYGCTRIPEDGEIDWATDTNDIDALVRALGPPFPGAFTWLRMKRLWVLTAEPSPSPKKYVGRIPGRVAERSAAEGWVDVLTGDGVLRIHLVRYQDQARRAARAMTSTRQTLGVNSGELIDRLLELELRLVEDETPSLDH